MENSSGTYYEGGLAKVGGKLKEFKAADPDHTFIISSGDMWQGSMESNLNEGALITEAMNNIGFDSMTLGNHGDAVNVAPTEQDFTGIDLVNRLVGEELFHSL